MGTNDRQYQRSQTEYGCSNEDRLERCEEDPEMFELLTAKELGNLGEKVAASFLTQHGYDVVERNYRCREGEADLVAHDVGEDEIILVEVKTRRARPGQRDIYPEEAVDARKQLKYARIAACYVMDRFPVTALRFDVVAVTFFTGMSAQVEHITNAFQWDADR